MRSTPPQKEYSTETDSVVVVAGNIAWLNFTLEKTSGSVAGHVLDSGSEDPVSGALIELFRSGDVNSSYAKKTDANGSFQIDNVDVGDYDVVVTATGFETNDTETVNVAAGEITSWTSF